MKQPEVRAAYIPKGKQEDSSGCHVILDTFFPRADTLFRMTFVIAIPLSLYDN